jgi:glucose-6-phosphate 1-dehydrogenase
LYLYNAATFCLPHPEKLPMEQSNKITPATKTAIVILGASGDLAQRKLVPALAECCKIHHFDNSTIIVGEGRSAFTDDTFRARFSISSEFSSRLYYHQGMTGLKRFLDARGSFGCIIVFMALPPSAYASAAEELARDGFGVETSIIIEKPFGYNASSARELNTSLHRYFSERQIFRIDHYLA